MKRNVIAILLSISLIAGSFGAVPSYAAEVTAQEEITENEQGGASVPSEDELSASGEEEAAAIASSQSADGQSVENEPVGGEEQIISNEIEEPGNGITQELDENEITEEGLSDEEAIGEEAGSAATDVDTEIAAVVEPTVESTKGKEAALEGEVVVDSGESGDLLWELTGDEAGMVLRISGNGYMTSYQEGSAPWATYRRLIETVIVEENVKSIGSYAFYGLNNMTSITLPSSMRMGIGMEAFASCSSLTSIDIPNGIDSIGYGAFHNCSGLKSVSIPDSVTRIDAHAFRNCSSLKNISIPNSVTTISMYAFFDCDSLEEIVIPENVTALNEAVFSNCDSLTSVTIEGRLTIIGEGAFGACVNLTDFTIPETVSIIKQKAFSRCTSLEEITIPKYVESVGWQAFYGCINLEEVIIQPGVELVYNGAFSNCSNLKHISIPNTVTSLGQGTLRDCTSLTEIVIPESVSTLELDLFNGCNGLKTVSLPNSIVSIQDNVFKGCNSLEQIVIPEGVTSIGNDAFSNCPQLCVIVYIGSFAENYAIENNIRYRAICKNHSWDVEYSIDKVPTCLEEGTESIHCSICGVIKEGTERTLDKTDHNYGDWRVVNEATCTSDGSREKECIICEDKVTEVIPATGHDYSEWRVLQEPTCINDGVKCICCSICGEEQDGGETAIPALGHMWEDQYTVDQEATCIDNGSESIHCAECDAINEETIRVISKKEHAYGDWTVIKEATCTEAGSKEKVCADCGDKVTEETPAKGHSWKEEYTVDQEATCTEEGSESIHCAECDAINDETIRVIPKKEHAYGDWTVTKEATCTEAGSREKVCADCGETDTVEIPAFGHLYGEVIIEPTCTTGGYTIHVCGRCGDSYIDHETTPTGHSFTDWVVDNDSTCTEEGIQHRECEDCGYTETKGINKKEHSFDTEYTVDKEPTCTADGSKSYHCTSEGCTATTGSEVIPATGHAYGDWTVTREATCTESGEMERTCAVCDESETVEFGARGHVWLKVYTVDQEATCTEEGSESIHCAECDAINDETIRVIPKKEHAYGDWTVTKEATCTEAGSREKVCADCGETDTVEIPALGHLYGEVVIEPTCTTGGHTTHVCGRCGDSYIDHETTPTGHSFTDWVVDNDSTCTEEGIQHRECEACGYTETKGINKKEHSFDTEYTVDKEPTCTADGSKSYHCTSEGCTATTGSEVIPATGHAYGDWTVTREATCTESGEMERTCAVCDESETVEFGARGHVWLKTPTVDQEATCTEAGSESIRCAVCDEIKEGSVQAIPPKGHRLIHFEAVEPTYESDGNIEYYRCEQCDHIFGDQNCDIEISASDIVIPALEWISVNQVSLNKSEITINRYVKEQLEVTVSPENATNKRVNWASSDENVAIVDENGAVTGNGFGDAVITATAEDGGISAQCTVHVVSRVKIVTQPANKAAESGETVAFTVEAEGNELSYQWQWSADGTTWKNCASASYNAATFTFVMKEKYAGRQYRCIVSGEGEIITSDAALLSLKEEEKFKVQPTDAEAADGEMASFHVEFEGDSPTYRWQWSANGTVWKNCTGSGYNTDTFSFVMKEKYEGWKYRCVVKDGTETYTSNVATLKLGKSLKITLQPEDATVSAGQSALFHVEAEGSSLSYQWQVSSTGTTWKNCTGAGYNTDTFSFTTKSTFSGRKYRCKISDGTNTIISDSAELTVTE